MRKSQIYIASALFLTSILSTSMAVYAGPPDIEMIAAYLKTDKVVQHIAKRVQEKIKNNTANPKLLEDKDFQGVNSKFMNDKHEPWNIKQIKFNTKADEIERVLKGLIPDDVLNSSVEAEKLAEGTYKFNYNPPVNNFGSDFHGRSSEFKKLMISAMDEANSIDAIASDLSRILFTVTLGKVEKGN